MIARQDQALVAPIMFTQIGPIGDVARKDEPGRDVISQRDDECTPNIVPQFTVTLSRMPQT